MEAADLVVINTCAIREAAEAKVIGRQGHLRHLKAANPGMRVVMTGCSVRESNRDRPGRGATRPWTCSCGRTRSRSWSTGWASRPRRRPWARSRRRRRPPLVHGASVSDAAHLVRARADAIAGGAVARHSAISAWLPIIYGCDKTCTYCIVPFSRGPERSRPFDEIVDEARALAAAGYREVTLLGQNVNSYGHDLAPEARFGHVHTARTVGRRQDREGRPDLAELIRAIDAAPDGRRRARDPAAALRDLAPVGPVRPADRGDARLPVGVRGAAPAGPVGRGHDAPPDGPPVHDRALRGAAGADPRGRAGHRALDGRDRRVLRRDRGRVRGHAPAPRDDPLRPGLRGRLQRATRDAGDAPAPTTSRPPRSAAGSTSCWRSRRASGSSATGRGSGGRPRCSSTASSRRAATTTTTRSPRAPRSRATRSRTCPRASRT